MGSNQDSLQDGKLSILKHFWEHSDDNMFIVVLDDENDFVVEDMNPAQLINFNIDPNQLFGTKLRDVLDEQVYISVEARYRRCLRLNVPQIYDENLIVEGRSRFWNTMIIPVTDSSDGKIRIFGIARELTALINAKNALATINDELEQTIASRTHELQQSNIQLKEQTVKLERQALTDTLTQAGNRRYFFSNSARLFKTAKEQNQPLSLIYLDLDNFKKLNDTHGHLAGDAVLKEFADRLKKTGEPSDIFARFGGEEFVILLPFTDSELATRRANNMLKTIADTPFTIENKSLTITSSIGVATITALAENSLDTLIMHADKALYFAKRNGKNRVEIY